MNTLEDKIALARDPGALAFQRRQAMAVLAASEDPRAAETLGTLLQDSDHYLRRDVVKLIGSMPRERALPLLIQASEDENEYVRQDTAVILGKVGNATVAEPLRRLAHDSSYSVRTSARSALEALGIPLTEIHPDDAAVEPEPEPEVVEEPIAAEPLPTPEPIPVAPPPPPPAAPTVRKELTDDFDWDQAHRFALLLGERVSLVRDFYRRLPSLQKQLRQTEARCFQLELAARKARAEGTGQDDMTEAVVQSREHATADAAREVREALQTVDRLEVAMQDPGWRIWTWIFRSGRVEMEKKLLAAKVALQKADERHQAVQSEFKVSRESLQQLRAETPEEKELKQARTLLDELRRQQEQVQHGISRELQVAALALLREDEGQRWDQLVAVAERPVFLIHLLNAWRELEREWPGQVRELRRRDQSIDYAAGKANRATTQLIEAVAAGFKTRQTERSTRVEVKTTLRGYFHDNWRKGRVISESIRGEGHVQSYYPIEEPDWETPARLEPAIAGFARAWSSVGASLGRRRQLHQLVARVRHLRQDYLHYLRHELERDFH